MADRLSWLFHVDSVPMTAAVVAGETSLGGSESACLGLARALKARGHDVTIAATRLDHAVPDYDAHGVRWVASEDMAQAQILIDPDVFVALRQPAIFATPIHARYRMLWNQDMLIGEGAVNHTMSLSWAFDRVAYVSEYQRKQWEGVAPDLKALGWVTKNGFDPSLVPTDVARVPHRIIHISRPERAMAPLLAMWPELKKRVPEAELHVCRYASMYDGEGSHVKAMVESYDAEIARVNAEVGGIVSLGQLNKRDLYRAIASASVMWYPGVVDFAETSCIAAIEAQACGTPLVCSYKGALPETAPHAWFVRGDAMSAEYQRTSVDVVAGVLEGAGWIRPAVRDGLAHAAAYTYDAIAADWEDHVWDACDQRSWAKRERVVASLLHEDDHTAALALTEDEAVKAECERVIRGEAQTADDYGHYALATKVEIDRKTQRHDVVVEAFAGKTRILDLACGNGAFAILLAEADPARHVTGYDYSQQNIDAANAEAEARGLTDRVTFERRVVCDLASGETSTELDGALAGASFDGVFLGEFCEHIGGITTFLDGVHRLVGPGAHVVVTVPTGPFSELLDVDTPNQKGHVHHFRPRDVEAVWGAQTGFVVDYLSCGKSPRNVPVGHWVIRYTTSDTPAGARPLSHWHRTIRPKQGLSVGILAHNATRWLNLCLDSVWQIADQIIIADCGSGGDRKELEHIAARFRAVLVNLPPVHQLEGGFAQARNITLGVASEEWFLWIDTDEELVGYHNVSKYLESGPFRGYAVRQNHLMLDAAAHFDTPVRLFKRGDDIEFYGCVHEQPQQGDCNGDIMPALQILDTQIAHLGYLHEGIRRQKSTARNLPLLVRDRQVYPDRTLGLVLWIRDYVTHANWMLEQSGGKRTPKILEYWGQAVALFEEHFSDPANKFHAIARPFYEMAVRHIRGAIEVEVAMGGAVQGLNGRRAEPKRFWVRTPAQIKPLLDHHQREALKVYDVTPVDVEPVHQSQERPHVVAPV